MTQSQRGQRSDSGTVGMLSSADLWPVFNAHFLVNRNCKHKCLRCACRSSRDGIGTAILPWWLWRLSLLRHKDAGHWTAVGEGARVPGPGLRYWKHSRFCVPAKLILDSRVICVVWGSPECIVYCAGTRLFTLIPHYSLQKYRYIFVTELVSILPWFLINISTLLCHNFSYVWLYYNVYYDYCWLIFSGSIFFKFVWLRMSNPALVL